MFVILGEKNKKHETKLLSKFIIILFFKQFIIEEKRLNIVIYVGLNYYSTKGHISLFQEEDSQNLSSFIE